jgi:hypothetical protein
VLEFYRDYIEQAPESMGAFFGIQNALPMPFIPESRHGQTCALIVACWAAPLEQGEQALRPIRKAGPVVGELIAPMSFPALNSAFDAVLHPGLHMYVKANFATSLTEGAVAAHLEHGSKTQGLLSATHIYPINGACNRVPADATAFPYREAHFATVVGGVTEDPADNPRNIKWVKGYYEALRPHSSAGAYVNFMSEDDGQRVRDNYKGHYERLASIKRRYDPDNIFHINQNIKPS